MRYIDISSYKAINLDRHVVETPFTGKHCTIRNPITGKLEVVLYEDGVLETLPGFMHDWASGPTFDTKKNRIAALEHDALFRLLRSGKVDHFGWKEADKFLQQRLKDNGMSAFRAWVWYAGRQMPFVARGAQAKPTEEPAYTVQVV